MKIKKAFIYGTSIIIAFLNVYLVTKKIHKFMEKGEVFREQWKIGEFPKKGKRRGINERL